MTICKKALTVPSVPSVTPNEWGWEGIKDKLNGLSWDRLTEPTKKIVRNGGIGALIGGTGLGLTGLLDSDEEAKSERGTRLRNNVMLGAVLGGLTGGGATAAYNALQTIKRPTGAAAPNNLQKAYLGARAVSTGAGAFSGVTAPATILGGAWTPTVLARKGLWSAVGKPSGFETDIANVKGILDSNAATTLNPTTGRAAFYDPAMKGHLTNLGQAKLHQELPRVAERGGSLFKQIQETAFPEVVDPALHSLSKDDLTAKGYTNAQTMVDAIAKHKADAAAALAEHGALDTQLKKFDVSKSTQAQAEVARVQAAIAKAKADYATHLKAGLKGYGPQAELANYQAELPQHQAELARALKEETYGKTKLTKDVAAALDKLNKFSKPPEVVGNIKPTYEQLLERVGNRPEVLKQYLDMAKNPTSKFPWARRVVGKSALGAGAGYGIGRILDAISPWADEKIMGWTPEQAKAWALKMQDHGAGQVKG